MKHLKRYETQNKILDWLAAITIGIIMGYFILSCVFGII